MNRDAQLTAMALFGNGNGEVTFNTPSRINGRTKAALDEMVKIGAVTVEKRGKALFYKSVKEKMGCPRFDFEPPQEHECFNIVDKA